MGVLLRLVTSTTLNRASKDLWNHTDSVHGCLALLTATVKKTPHLLTANPTHLAPLFHLGKLLSLSFTWLMPCLAVSESLILTLQYCILIQVIYCRRRGTEASRRGNCKISRSLSGKFCQYEQRPSWWQPSTNCCPQHRRPS